MASAVNAIPRTGSKVDTSVGKDEEGQGTWAGTMHAGIARSTAPARGGSLHTVLTTIWTRSGATNADTAGLELAR